MNLVHNRKLWFPSAGHTKVAFLKKLVPENPNKSLVKQAACFRVTQVNPGGPPRVLGAHLVSLEGSTP